MNDSRVQGQEKEGAVSRAFAVLEMLANSPEPVRLSAVALKLNMQKSTIHRILRTLTVLGYVEQVPETSCYRATLKIWEMGACLIAEHPVKRAASGFLQQLHGATRETVSLLILSGDDVLYLDKIMAPRPIRFTTRVGSRVPAPLVAGGKAILAHTPNALEILQSAIPRMPENQHVTVDEMLLELEEVRQKGYATSNFRSGVAGFAAPVAVREGYPAAALSVSAPKERLDEKKRAKIIESLLVTSAEIAERIGPL